MKSICFFSSYYNGNHIPFYVKFYLDELSRHFSEVVLITNEKEISLEDKSFLESNNILFMPVKNEGFDFGMWYKAFQSYGTTKYDRIALVNDSCILFGNLKGFFEWIEKEKPDFCGYTDSYLLGYHLQSYFLVINKKAIPFVAEYFKKSGVIQDIKEVIKIYEVGLSKYLTDNGMSIKAMYNIPSKGKYNYALLCGKNLIEMGFPLVKKKIISRLYTFERWRSMVVLGFDPFPSHYIKLIKNKYQVPVNLFEGIKKNKGIAFELRFYTISIIAILYRLIRKKS
ncbi:MAG: rhamnan synthesis F family protein [Bacteroidia bacterium]